MLKLFFWIAVGAAGALQADRWFSRQKAQWSPNSMTTRLFDRVNEKLESERARSAPPPTAP
jgi:hypothetical protein